MGGQLNAKRMFSGVKVKKDGKLYKYTEKHGSERWAK